MKWKSRLLFRDKDTKEDGHPSSSTPLPLDNSSRAAAEDSSRGGVATGDEKNDLQRSSTRHSELSNFEYQPELPIPTLSKHARQRSADRRLDPLGLTVLHIPEGTPTADIIFVHGLGGTSQQTWSYNRDAELFWPKLWLPSESDICTARILTFGYNAHFLSTGPNSISGISDFAKSLLFDMKFGRDDGGEDLGVGKWPIIFVVHSMGGLVFKKAYIQAGNNDDYKDIVSQVRAVLFLSTPHRGTNLADLLNRILSVSIFNHGPKQYVNELRQNSSVIEDINEDFRGHASKIQIFSFYETLETPVGLKNVMVLQKGSATLGYPGEISEPLNADHHHVCKFPNKQDTGYKSLRSVLKTLISAYREEGAKAQKLMLEAELHQISVLLGSIPTSEDDYTSLLDQWRPGTCDNMFSNAKNVYWKHSSKDSKILWVHAQPGSGKSVKSAVQIRHIRELGETCIYFFFKFGDSTKRSPGSLLRSLAFQLAQEIPSFRKALLIMKENGVRVEKMEARLLWEKIFVATLFKLEFKGPLYFVIDALDESDSINTVIGFLSRISSSMTPLRVLVTSRKTSEIAKAFERISSMTPVDDISIAENIDDIRLYATSEMEYMHGTVEFRDEIVSEIITRAEGNFLWVHLVLKEILQCHSPDDVKQALSEIPPGMEAIYKRMEAAIARLSRASDVSLAKLILSWATYARRPLETEELMRALQSKMPSIIDLQFTISQICGNFVVVDHNNHVTLVHQTAREYLVKNAQLPFSLNAREVQEELFCGTLSIFLETQIRSKMNQNPFPPFYEYAATSWAYHLGRSSAGSDAALTLLVKFLGSTSVAYWMRILASSRQLKVLVSTSSVLNSFAEKRRKLDSTVRPTQHRLKDLELLENWATDLLKLVGKFGSHLIQDPTAIIKSIPQFCPRNSAVFRQFWKQAQVSVKGISNDDWDDCLARVSISSGHQAIKVICSTRHIAVLTSGGTISLWDSITFEEIRSISQQEHIFAACFSDDGQILASYGFNTTRIWNPSTGRQLHKIGNPPDCRPLCISFVEGNTKLLVGLSSRKVAELSLEKERIEWSVINSSFLEEENSIDGAYLNAPTSMAFNADGTYIAVAYRGFPLAVWDMLEKKRTKRCRRESKNNHRPGDVWSGVNKVIWHPNNEEILGIYTDGIVFKWNPFEEIHEELQSDLYSAPSEIQCSPNGVVFATSDVNGVVKIYNYEHFSLIYQLSSEDIITSLCFSPDSRRFYDIRGSYCNVWEPNALFRLPDIDEQGSEVDTEAGSMIVSHHASEAWAEMPDPITALSPRPQGGFFCAGNEDGQVELKDLTNLSPIQMENSRGYMGIEFIEWADDGERFAYSDGDTITIMKIVSPMKDIGQLSPSVQPIVNIKADLESGKIHQIVLSPDASLVIVVGSDTSQLWSSQSKKLCKTTKTQNLQKWANHPLESKQVLAFMVGCIISYTWDNLEIVSQWQINTTLPPYPSTPRSPMGSRKPELPRHGSSSFSESNVEVQEYVDEVIVSHSSEYVLVLISQQVGSHHRPWSRLQILETSFLKDTDASNVDPMILPEDITTAISRPVGILGKDQFVFLDKNFWVCSWRLRSTGGLNDLVRHFFLPRDWISLEVLRLCRVLADGTFLCPRKGQIAVIRSSLGQDW